MVHFFNQAYEEGTPADHDFKYIEFLEIFNSNRQLKNTSYSPTESITTDIEQLVLPDDDVPQEMEMDDNNNALTKPSKANWRKPPLRFANYSYQPDDSISLTVEPFECDSCTTQLATVSITDCTTFDVVKSTDTTSPLLGTYKIIRVLIPNKIEKKMQSNETTRPLRRMYKRRSQKRPCCLTSTECKPRKRRKKSVISESIEDNSTEVLLENNNKDTSDECLSDNENTFEKIMNNVIIEASFDLRLPDSEFVMNVKFNGYDEIRLTEPMTQKLFQFTDPEWIKVREICYQIKCFQYCTTDEMPSCKAFLERVLFYIIKTRNQIQLTTVNKNFCQYRAALVERAHISAGLLDAVDTYFAKCLNDIS